MANGSEDFEIRDIIKVFVHLLFVFWIGPYFMYLLIRGLGVLRGLFTWFLIIFLSIILFCLFLFLRHGACRIFGTSKEVKRGKMKRGTKI